MVEAIELEVVSAHNSRLVRVHACNWKMVAGDFWLISGAHDSGKSDFTATAAGLQRSGAGTLRLFGEDVAAVGESDMLRKRLRIGFVFRGGGRMFPDLTVAENIALPLRYHRQITDEELGNAVGDLVDVMGMSDLAEFKTREVGTNWLGRVGLARAMALQPEILFLDEPISGLEGRHRRWWLDFLARLWSGETGYLAEGISLVLTANDPDPWLDQCRQFGLIRDKHLQILGREELRQAETAWVESERTAMWTRKSKQP